MGWMSKPAVGEGHITILAPSYDSIGQGEWTFTMDPSQYLEAILVNSTVANGDNLSYQVYLDAGTYTLLFFTELRPDEGIIDIDINDTEVASFDLYDGNIVYNTIKTQAGIVIAMPGLYTLKCRVDGKNPLSDAWLVDISYIALWRTA